MSCLPCRARRRQLHSAAAAPTTRASSFRALCRMTACVSGRPLAEARGEWRARVWTRSAFEPEHRRPRRRTSLRRVLAPRGARPRRRAAARRRCRAMRREWVERFVGVDPLRGAQPRAFAFAQAIAEYLPFRDGVFDRVLFATSIDHVLLPELALAEARRVSKSGRHGLRLDRRSRSAATARGPTRATVAKTGSRGDHDTASDDALPRPREEPRTRSTSPIRASSSWSSWLNAPAWTRSRGAASAGSRQLLPARVVP